MNFYNWMIQNYINDRSTTGAVARLMNANKKMFRRARGYTKNRNNFEQLTSRQDYYDAFDRAWGVYQSLWLQNSNA